MFHFFALSNAHKPARNPDQGLRLSDFISYDQGHIEFHTVRILAIAAIVLIIALGFFGLVRPDIANKPIPGRYLLVVAIIVALVVGWTLYAGIHERHLAGDE